RWNRDGHRAGAGSNVELQLDAAHAEQALLTWVPGEQQLHALEKRRRLRHNSLPVVLAAGRANADLQHADVGTAGPGPSSPLHHVEGVGSAGPESERTRAVGDRRPALNRRALVAYRSALKVNA